MKIKDDGVRFLFVWEPVLPTDARERAVDHLRAENDARARHLWDDDLVLAKTLAQPLRSAEAIPGEGGTIAWDVVMLYPRGVTWTDTFPMPKLYRFPRTFSDIPGFDTAEFRQQVEAELRR